MDIFLGYRFEGKEKGESVRGISQRLSLLAIAEEGDNFGGTGANMI